MSTPLNQMVRNDASKDEEKTLSAAKDLEPKVWVAVALTLYHLKRYDESIWKFTRILDVDNMNSPSWNGRALCYFKQRKYEKAISEYSRAIELDGNTPEYWFNRGQSYEALNKHKEALSDYIKSVDILESVHDHNTPKKWEYQLAWSFRGRCLMKLQRHQEAISFLLKGVEMNGREELFWSNALLGDYYYESNQYEKALDNFKTSTSLGSHRAICHYRLGVCKVNTGTDISLLEEYFNSAIKLGIKIADCYIQRGDVYLSKDMSDRARLDYRKATRLEPLNPECWFKLAHILQKVDDKDALVKYDRAVELDETDPKYIYGRGLYYMNRGKRERALRDLTKAIMLRSGDMQFHHSRGMCYKAMKRYEEAIEDLTVAVDLSPSNLIYISDRATCLLLAGRVKEVLSDSTRYIDSYLFDPKKPKDKKDKVDIYLSSLLFRAKCYLEMEQYDFAEGDLGKILSSLTATSNQKYEAHTLSGTCNRKQRKFEKAVLCFTKVIKMKAKEADAHYNRGMSYMEMKEYNKAMVDLMKAVELQPDRVQFRVDRITLMKTVLAIDEEVVRRDTVKRKEEERNEKDRDETKAVLLSSPTKPACPNSISHPFTSDTPSLPIDVTEKKGNEPFASIPSPFLTVLEVEEKGEREKQENNIKREKRVSEEEEKNEEEKVIEISPSSTSLPIEPSFDSSTNKSPSDDLPTQSASKPSTSSLPSSSVDPSSGTGSSPFKINGKKREREEYSGGEVKVIEKPPSSTSLPIEPSFDSNLWASTFTSSFPSSSVDPSSSSSTSFTSDAFNFTFNSDSLTKHSTGSSEQKLNPHQQESTVQSSAPSEFSFGFSSVFPSFSLSTSSHLHSSKVGRVEAWEQNILNDCGLGKLKEAYVKIATKQDSMERMKIWLEMAMEGNGTTSQETIGSSPIRVSEVLFIVSSIILQGYEVTYNNYISLIDEKQTISSVCLLISALQPSFNHTRAWLNAGTTSQTAGWEECSAYENILTYFSEKDIKYKRYDAALSLNLLLPRLLILLPRSDCLRYLRTNEVSSLQSFISITLLCGSLKKNKQTSLYRSFFSSKMTEVQLLPLIARYLYKGEKEREKEAGKPVLYMEIETESETEYRYESTCLNVDSLKDISTYLISSLPGYRLNSYGSLNFYFNQNYNLNAFAPLILSRSISPWATSWTFCGDEGYSKNQRFGFTDLSFLPHSPTSNITSLEFKSCCIPSLSPLSLCDFPNITSLEFLSCRGIPSLSPLSLCDFPRLTHLTIQVSGKNNLKSLDGFTNSITQNLKELNLVCNDLSDISALRGCNFSRLQTLSLLACYPLSDLSPLVDMDFPSLTAVCLEQTQISDISVITTWKNFSPQTLNFHGSKVEDISPLSLLLSSTHRGTPASSTPSSPSSPRRIEIYLSDTLVFDISPLENISTPCSIDVDHTPFAKKEREMKKSHDTHRKYNKCYFTKKGNLFVTY